MKLNNQVSVLLRVFVDGHTETSDQFLLLVTDNLLVAPLDGINLPVQVCKVEVHSNYTLDQRNVFLKQKIVIVTLSCKDLVRGNLRHQDQISW